jgi:hypothetical protein
MNMILSDTEKSITPEYIIDFEKEITSKLPESFISHYLMHNGGFPNADRIKGEQKIFSIDGFIPIKYGILTIEKLIIDLHTELPEGNFVPFANDEAGNLFILSLNNQDYGHIYLLTAETNEIIYVCNAFETFIAGLITL